MHPGYGFFSENADFARAITAKGVDVHRAAARSHRRDGRQGVSSRMAALRGGAPIVPGTTEFATARRRDPRLRRRARLAARHQGRVRRRRPRHEGGASRRRGATRRWTSAQREAKAFFGRDEIYIERYLTWPRHVEVQIVGDQHGDVVWVSTRDCSAQRRHQKLIEEAPAHGLAPGVEEAMGEAAVKAAKAVGYYNAGTVEFIYQDGEFFFLEMNTRLQVEHPVTEVITGIDLVEWQIRVAGGEPLPMTQDEVAAAPPRPRASRSASTPRTRPAASSCPSPGTITKLVAPDGFGVRFDAGYETGDAISQYYDNLVGKLIVWGKDRPTAIARTIRALEEMVVEGVATTIPADLAILRHPDFQAMRALDEVGRGDARPVGHRRRRSRRAPADDDDGAAGRAHRPPSRSTASAST